MQNISGIVNFNTFSKYSLITDVDKIYVVIRNSTGLIDLVRLSTNDYEFFIDYDKYGTAKYDNVVIGYKI